MIDKTKLVDQDMMGEFGEVIGTLHRAAEIIETADRISDESVKAPLLDGAQQMLQNVLDAMNGRRTDGLVQPAPDEEDE